MLIKDSMNQVLEQAGASFSVRFYRTLFDRFPELERLFRDVNMKHQAAMLTMSLQVVAQHYRRPRRISTDYLKTLGHRHHQRGVTEDDYRKFQEVLLDTLAGYHGDDWTPNLAKQWDEAFAGAIDVMRQGGRDEPTSDP